MTKIEKATALYDKAIKKDLLENDVEKNKFIKELLTGDLGKRINDSIDANKIEKQSRVNKIFNKLKVIWNV